MGWELAWSVFDNVKNSRKGRCGASTTISSTSRPQLPVAQLPNHPSKAQIKFWYPTKSLNSDDQSAIPQSKLIGSRYTCNSNVPNAPLEKEEIASEITDFQQSAEPNKKKGATDPPREATLKSQRDVQFLRHSMAQKPWRGSVPPTTSIFFN